ncbi:MAG TPA: phytanoyl-CoA dioxygenase family protein [Myxococcota bacterium]|nr:phytanoyl-CoA dioxygenase family protein [Myxococcota bacterium]
MRLTSAQVLAFRERGYTSLGQVFSTAELEEIRSAYDLALAKPMHIGERGKSKFEYAPLLQLRSPALRRFATSRVLVEPLLELLGPEVRLYWDQAVSKPPGTGSETPWHQDNGYGAVEPAEYVTATLAVDAMTAANGCLWIQPGSHRAGPVPHRDTGAFFQIGYEGSATGEPLELAAGEVGIFSSLTLHRAGPNPTALPRRSWVIQFIPAHAIHGETRKPFDDRLWVARGGCILEEPWSERPFEL